MLETAPPSPSLPRVRPADIAARDRRHLVITGTGRAGTTLLVQYLTVLGFDTGFSRQQGLEGLSRNGHAGFEHTKFPADGIPYVLKAPALIGQIPRALESGDVAIDAAIVPVRDIFAAAESRRAVSRQRATPEQPSPQPPGGVWRTDDPANQEAALLELFYRLIESLVRFDVPTWFLPFPAFARDHAVLWHRLGPLLERYGVTAEESADAFAAVVRPEWIHDFVRPVEPTPAPPAEANPAPPAPRPGIDFTPVD